MVNKILVLVCLLSLAGSEYVWNGTEWEWQDSKDTSSSDGDSGVVEGSGDDYDDEYDGEDYEDRNYNYDDVDEEKVYKSSPTDTLHHNSFSSDDEDFVEEGSGDYDHDVKETNFGSTEKERESNHGDDGSDIYVEHTDWWDKGHQDNKNVYQEDKNEFNNNNGFYDHVDPNENRGGAVNEVPEFHDTPHTTPKTESEVQKKKPTNQHPASFFAQPGILAAVIGGAVVGLLCAILLVMFIIYRMRKKDEGSYIRHDPKPPQNVNPYSGPTRREFYS